MSKHIILLSFIFMSVAQAFAQSETQTNPRTADEVLKQKDQILTWLQSAKVPAVGIGLIRKGRIVFTGVFGQLREGVAAPDNAIFNVASLTKPVVSMLTLKLVEAGQWDLDEPLSNYWIDPDLQEDPRHKLLTTRHVLKHQTGFNNWRHWNESGKLAFLFAPGSDYKYSGEGFEYLKEAMERKFGRTLPELVDSLVFQPIGLSQTKFTWDALTDTTHFAHWHDGAGENTYHDYQINTVSAADNLLTTVEDYSRFILHVMQGNALSPTLFQEISDTTVMTRPGIYMGLGWEVVPNLENDEYALIHSGSDRGVKTLAIFLPRSQEGLILFTNGDNGMQLVGKLVPHLLTQGQELLERGQ